MSAERARLLYRLRREEAAEEIEERRTEGVRRENEVFSTQAPWLFDGSDGPLIAIHVPFRVPT